MYTEMFSQMKKQLGQLDKWLGAAGGICQGEIVRPERPAGLRLAPDQFPLTRQVQICCDTVKLAASYLSGNPPSLSPIPNRRSKNCRLVCARSSRYLEGFTAEDFAGAATRVVSQPRWKGEWMTGADYSVQHALPNFFFHLTTAYAILRHNGVARENAIYLGAQTERPPAA